MTKKKQEPIKEEPKEVISLPLHRFEVMVGENFPKVEVYAQLANVDGDDLQFINLSYEDEESEVEEVVATFKQWLYFVRRESDLEEGKKVFESLGKLKEGQWCCQKAESPKDSYDAD